MSRAERPVENVWDYPRPPALVRSDERVVVEVGGSVLARTDRAWRVLETSHPPTYYLPWEDVDADLLVPSDRRSWCEWKGRARYFDVVAGGLRLPDAAWTYPDPTPAFAPITGHLALYPGRMDRCLVDGEQVQAQEGDFYGGWITSRITGPFKGPPGTMGW